MASRCKCNQTNRNSIRSSLKFGHYYRKSDRKWIQRFKCTLCLHYFSSSSTSPCYGQKKRHINGKLLKLLVSGVSLRRSSRLLKVSQITVARKLEFLGARARLANHRQRQKMMDIRKIQFDDMETFEHTKLKPLSITLAVAKDSRYILGFEVSKIPANGSLFKPSREKYGSRPDQRASGRDRLFRRLKDSVSPRATIESDSNPHYPRDVRKHFPWATHLTYLGKRGAITGQGELKKLKFDPLFSLNHTCAMFRANVNRLIRKTWCTTKRIQPLADHLEIYSWYHNQVLIASQN